jgi:hypothetical protein
VCLQPDTAPVGPGRRRGGAGLDLDLFGYLHRYGGYRR